MALVQVISCANLLRIREICNVPSFETVSLLLRVLGVHFPLVFGLRLGGLVLVVEGAPGK